MPALDLLPALFAKEIKILRERDPGKTEPGIVWSVEAPKGVIAGNWRSPRKLAKGESFSFHQEIVPPLSTEFLLVNVAVVDHDARRISKLLDRLRSGTRGRAGKVLKSILGSAAGPPVALGLDLAAELTGFVAEDDVLCEAVFFLHSGSQPGNLDFPGPEKGPSADLVVEVIK